MPLLRAGFCNLVSRSTAHISGTSANHARNQYSKSGKDRMSRTAARIASKTFLHDGKIVPGLGIFIAVV